MSSVYTHIRRMDKLAIVAMAVTAIVLLGAYAIPSVFAKAIQVNSDFETDVIPACTTEEVVYSGTQHLVIQEANGRQIAHINYQNVKE